jgi:hypothetical protein
VIPIQSPVASTLSWFSAVNAHNGPLAFAHFAPADRNQMDWSQWGPPFTDLHCSQRSQAKATADVYCTFAPQNDPALGLSGDYYFSFGLERVPSGRWLITGYGQP